MNLLILAGLWGCIEEKLVYNTTTDVNMTTYLEERPDQFSQLRKVLDLSGTATFLNAYGAYTLFAPTDDAFDSFLQEKGVSSVEDLSTDDLKGLVRFHLLSDTIRSNTFNDGKLPSLTMYGQYLITGAKNVGGETKVVVNRQANIIQSDVKVGNGLIHVIDAVLKPAQYSVAQLVENNPEFSVFTQALKETGLYDTLNILPANNTNEDQKFLTLLAETDSVLNVAGFPDYTALKARYCNTGNPMSVDDSLHKFVAYHIVYGAKYLADIATSQSQNTLAPLEVLTTSMVGTTILINDVVFMGVYEPGSQLDRNRSDYSANNGVLNSVKQHIQLKVRQPVRIDWDVADQPEFRKYTAIFRKSTTTINLTKSAGDPFVDIDWQDGAMLFGPTYSWSTSSSITSAMLYSDMLMLPTGGPNRVLWWEFRTPLIVRGKYKVWATDGRSNQAVPLM